MLIRLFRYYTISQASAGDYTMLGVIDGPMCSNQLRGFIWTRIMVSCWALSSALPSNMIYETKLYINNIFCCNKLSSKKRSFLERIL